MLFDKAKKAFSIDISNPDAILANIYRVHYGGIITARILVFADYGHVTFRY